MYATASKGKYYFLRNSSGGKETGNVVPQCTDMTVEYNYSAQNSVRHIRHNVFPVNNPNLDAYKLERKAKLTDFLSKTNPYFGYLVSEKAKRIFEDFKLPEHRFYPAKVKTNKTYENYYLFHINSDFSNNFDYSKAEFSVVQVLKEKEKFTVSNADELKKKAESVLPFSKVVPKKLSLKEGYKIPFDIFHISFIDPRTYISHNLKTALEEANITGIEIVPTDVI